MQVPDRQTTRFGKRNFRVIFSVFVILFVLSLHQARGENTDIMQVAKKSYFVGTSKEVRDKVVNQTMGHKLTVGNTYEQAELRKPYPACGAKIYKTFADYCADNLQTGMAPCTVRDTLVMCSTDYLEPVENKIFWRLRYSHHISQASIELEILKRGKTGRLEETISYTNKLEELFDNLLLISRCD